MAVDFHHRIVNRQNHKRQEVVDHAQHYRTRRVHHFLSRQTKGLQDSVDDPCSFQQHLPCHGPEQEVHPHRQDQHENRKALFSELAVPKHDCHRECHNQAHQCAHQRQQQRQPQRLHVVGAEHGGDIIQSNPSASGRESVIGNGEDGNDRSGNHKDDERCRPFLAKCQFQSPPLPVSLVCA